MFQIPNISSEQVREGGRGLKSGTGELTSLIGCPVDQ